MNVANEYFDKYFPLAAKTGAALRNLNNTTPGAGPLKWMTFSWLVSLYFDCPTGYGLHCPDDAAKAVVESAIKAEDIVWAAFPHNAELSTVDPSYLKFGVRMSQNLAKQFNVTPPAVVSTRDVPGMPRAALGVLADAGVVGVSEGMNGRIWPVNVPPAFQWVAQRARGDVTSHSADDIAMPTLWHWKGYGSLGDPGDPIRIPGSKYALAYCWRGDNAGPPTSSAEILQNAKTLQQQFSHQNPNAWIYRAGLLDKRHFLQEEEEQRQEQQQTMTTPPRS